MFLYFPFALTYFPSYQGLEKSDSYPKATRGKANVHSRHFPPLPFPRHIKMRRQYMPLQAAMHIYLSPLALPSALDCVLKRYYQYFL